MQNVNDYLDLLKKNRRGKLKIYIGMSAGVGKTYRILREAHLLLSNHIDVRISYIKTHFRKETQDLLARIPIIQWKKCIRISTKERTFEKITERKNWRSIFKDLC